MEIRYSSVVVLSCPQCGTKSVYFFSKEIACFLCNWTKKRKFPTKGIDDFFSFGPLTPSTSGEQLRKAIMKAVHYYRPRPGYHH